MSAASSRIVAGRRPPSRWSCSSTLGARSTWSRVGTVGSGEAAVMPAIQPPRPTFRRGHEEPHMRVFTTLDEVAAAAGEEIGTSDWVTIDQERVNRFAEATDDFQWIHVDVERAKAGPFGGTIAHGYLTLSLLPLFGSQIFEPADPRRQAQLRAQQGALPHPGAGRLAAARHLHLHRRDRRRRGQAGHHELRGRDRGRGQARPASPSSWCCCCPDPPGRPHERVLEPPLMRTTRCGQLMRSITRGEGWYDAEPVPSGPVAMS